MEELKYMLKKQIIKMKLIVVEKYRTALVGRNWLKFLKIDFNKYFNDYEVVQNEGAKPLNDKYPQFKEIIEIIKIDKSCQENKLKPKQFCKQTCKNAPSPWNKITPHCSTNETPANLFMKRNLNSRWNLLQPQHVTTGTQNECDVSFEIGDKVYIKSFYG